LRVSVRLRRDLGQRLQDAHGLSMADYDLLVRLAEQPGRRMRMAELADAILQPRSSLTRIADDLQRRGLIRRQPSATDGRGFDAVLTPRGQTLFRKAQRTHLDGVRRRFLDVLDDEQLQQLADIWAAIDPTALSPAPDESAATSDRTD
jgi:DNA-binding MarR family transcriptional regulator